jgi:predicted glycosyltransferase
VRVWVDLTAPAHVLVFRPLIQRMRAAGHDVEVTARDYAQTLALCELHGIEHHVVGSHGGRSALGKARSLAGRSLAVARWARERRFDLAAAHGSNDLPLAAALLRVPAVDMFDYEYATYQHTIGCRIARRVLVPESIPPRRLRRYGVRAPKLVRYPGLKEEYYLSDFEPDREVPSRLGVDERRVVVTLRTPPDVAMYHRGTNLLFPRLVERLGRDPGVHAVALPRTADQGEALRARALPSLIVPKTAVDAQSLIAASDLVVSAGGTMNREAVALGVPVYTTFGGRMGGVDERLIASGRLRPLRDPAELVLVKRVDRADTRTRRDPQWLADRMLEAARR